MEAFALRSPRAGLPAFVKREFEAYLRWGILARARALRRVRCPRPFCSGVVSMLLESGLGVPGVSISGLAAGTCQGPSDGLPFALISQSMIAEGSGDSDSGRAAPLRGAGLAT